MKESAKAKILFTAESKVERSKIYEFIKHEGTVDIDKDFGFSTMLGQSRKIFETPVEEVMFSQAQFSFPQVSDTLKMTLTENDADRVARLFNIFSQQEYIEDDALAGVTPKVALEKWQAKQFLLKTFSLGKKKMPETDSERYEQARSKVQKLYKLLQQNSNAAVKFCKKLISEFRFSDKAEVESLGVTYDIKRHNEGMDYLKSISKLKPNNALRVAFSKRVGVFAAQSISKLDAAIAAEKTKKAQIRP